MKKFCLNSNDFTVFVSYSRSIMKRYNKRNSNKNIYNLRLHQKKSVSCEIPMIKQVIMTLYSSFYVRLLFALRLFQC
jgi:hypothetical protein